VHALGNLKDQYFLQHLEQHGVEVYGSSIAPVRTLRAQADDIHYPGTYLAGGYNRLRTDIADIADQVVENEDLANFPNCLVFEFRITDGHAHPTTSFSLLARC
jgi:trehalose/maltose hydrolase-like predicted phosphorylase